MIKPKRPKTQTERLADLAKRRADQGLKRATFWLSEAARAVLTELAKVHGSKDRAVEAAVLALSVAQRPPPKSAGELADEAYFDGPDWTPEQVAQMKAHGPLSGGSINTLPPFVLSDPVSGALSAAFKSDSARRTVKVLAEEPPQKPTQPEKPVSRPKVAGKVSKAAPGPSGGLSVPYGRPRVEPGSRLKKDAKR